MSTDPYKKSHQKLTGYTISQFEILVVMGEMVLLHVLHILREFRVVQADSYL